VEKNSLAHGQPDCDCKVAQNISEAVPGICWATYFRIPAKAIALLPICCDALQYSFINESNEMPSCLLPSYKLFSNHSKMLPLFPDEYALVPYEGRSKAKHAVPHSPRISMHASQVHAMRLKPHCIRCSHFKVDDVSALEVISKPPVGIVEDNVTASLHQQRTP
jgi:hypothetical protein